MGGFQFVTSLPTVVIVCLVEGSRAPGPEVVLICISLAAGDVGHRFLCLLAILFFSLETRLFHLFARLYIELLVFLLL